MVLRGGTFGECFSHEGAVFMNGIHVLIKELQGDPKPCSLCGDTMRGCQLYEPRRESSSELDNAGALFLEFLISRTVRNNFLLSVSYLGCGIVL